MRDTYIQYPRPEPTDWRIWGMVAMLALWALFEINQWGYWDARDAIEGIKANERAIVLQRVTYLNTEGK